MELPPVRKKESGNFPLEMIKKPSRGNLLSGNILVSSSLFYPVVSFHISVKFKITLSDVFTVILAHELLGPQWLYLF